MTRFLITLIAAFAASGVMANTVTLGSAAGHPGDEVTVGLSMSGSDAVTALEAVIPLDSHLEYVDGSVALAPGRSNGHQATAKVVDGSLRIYAYSLSLADFAGTEGTLLTFKLRLGATSGDLALNARVLLSDAVGSNVGATVVPGNTTILSPMLEIVNQQIDFGHIPIRSTYESTLTLRNNGNEPLHIANFVPADSELAVTPASAVIEPGSTADFSVAYSPLKRTRFDATIDVESDAVNAKRFGKWLAANVVADPYSVNELHVQQATGASDSEVEVRLSLNNMEPIVGAQMSFNLSGVLEYVDGSAQVTSRGVDHRVTAHLDGNALRLYAYSPTNTPLEGEDGDFLTFRVKLNGRSGWYWIQPEQVILGNVGLENMTSATYGEYVIIESPMFVGDESLDFGEQPVTRDLTSSFYVGNCGQRDLVIDRVNFLADGFEVVTPLPLTVTPGGEAMLDVVYRTEEAGSRTTTMNIYTNDPERRLLQVPVSWTGYSPNHISVTGRSDGNDYTINVLLSNNDPVAGLQFDIVADQPVTLSGIPTVVPTDRLARHNCNIYPMGPGRWRVVVYSMANDLIDKGYGDIMSVTFPCDRPLVDNPFNFENEVLSSSDGRNVVTGIDDAAVSEMRIIRCGSQIEVQGLPDDVELSLYDLSGRLLYRGLSRTLTLPCATPVILHPDQYPSR